jgi:hypothetical protein
MTREPMAERELEATLTDLGERLDYPRPTRLADAVRMRLSEPRSRRWWDAIVSPRYAFAPALATLLLIVVVSFAAVPEMRAAADEFLRLRGIDIFRTASTPAPVASASIQFPGDRVSLEDARRRAPFLRVPTDPRLGTPDQVYIDQTQAGTRVTLVYVSRAGIPASREAGVSAVVVAFRGRVDEQALFGKGIPVGSRIEEVTVNGGRGFWIEGAPHQFFYRDAAGDIQPETLRLAGNTLLWEQSDATFRLEAQVRRDEAIRIGASAR